VYYYDEFWSTGVLVKLAVSISAFLLTAASSTFGQDLPDFSGLPLGEARSAAESLGFIVNVRGIASVLPIDAIVSSNPPVGAAALPGSKVTLIYSEGISIPDVFGKNANTIIKSLEEQGLNVTVEYKSVKPHPRGLVVMQDPAPGIVFDASKRSVELLVTEGKTTIVPSNLTDQNLSTVLMELSKVGLQGFVSEGPEHDSTSPWTCSTDVPNACTHCSFSPKVTSVFPTSGTATWPNDTIALLTEANPTDDCQTVSGNCSADLLACQPD
jgi:beta-lactam-binding protein with PASTA domain